MGVIKTLDPDLGDMPLSWDKGKPAEVEAARQTFEFLTKEKRYAAYLPGKKKGEKGQLVRVFDVNAEELIMVPQLGGG